MNYKIFLSKHIFASYLPYLQSHWGTVLGGVGRKSSPFLMFLWLYLGVRLTGVRATAPHRKLRSVTSDNL